MFYRRLKEVFMAGFDLDPQATYDFAKKGLSSADEIKDELKKYKAALESIAEETDAKDLRALAEGSGADAIFALGKTLDSFMELFESMRKEGVNVGIATGNEVE